MKYMFMPLRRYADFSGRSRRSEFWLWQLFNVIVFCLLWIPLAIHFTSTLHRLNDRGGLYTSQTSSYDRYDDRDRDRSSSRYDDEESSSYSEDEGSSRYDEDRPSRRSGNRSSGGYSFGSDWSADVDPEMFMEEFGALGWVFISLFGLWWLFTLIPNLAVTIRRLHDSNHSGWWVTAPFFAYLGAIILVVLAALMPTSILVLAPIIWVLLTVAGLAGLVVFIFMFFDGTPAPNRFGPDPKERDFRNTFG
jgi:uncharacterized membrane protein YhaH (DUF805 family)